MANISTLERAKSDIRTFFQSADPRVFSLPQLAATLSANRDNWKLASSVTTNRFISFLLKAGQLREHEFRSDQYQRHVTRYAWGTVSNLQLAASISSRGYFSHATALMLHGLTSFRSHTAYLNIEQSAKPARASALNQDGINRAFAKKQRHSNLIYDHDDLSVVIIAGKNTHRLGVEQVSGHSSELLHATNLERTLIDCVVRPAYSGGVHYVLNAFRAARRRASGDRLVQTLTTLNYSYPYHQAIGFFMEMAGYPKQEYEKLRSLGLRYDFYLCHEMESPEYSTEWRLFFPQTLKQ